MTNRILVLGVTGMLGNTLFRGLTQDVELQVYGTMRDEADLRFFSNASHTQLFSHIDVLDKEALINVFDKVRPDVVINCTGLIKQHTASQDPLLILPINAMFPHQLSTLCAFYSARLIHISTDCVFSGKTGMYTEDCVSDAEDLYGKSKYIGELPDDPHALTLRTSNIGHALKGSLSLVDWFLSQEDSVQGYTHATFSGLPAIELAGIIHHIIIPRDDLSGVYHISTKPITKFELLKLISECYEKKIDIIPNDALQIDRSLDSTRFKEKTGYIPPSWPDLILKMRCSKISKELL